MKEKTVPQLLKEFIDGVTKAEAGAAMMIHEHMDPRFFDLRFKLGAIKGATMKLIKRGKSLHVR